MLDVLFAHRFGWTPEQVRRLTVHEVKLFLESFKSTG